MLRQLARFTFSQGYVSSASKALTSDYLADGSQNILVTGSGKNVVFKGTTVKNAVTGSQVMMNVGSGYGGLGDHTETGIGNIFRVLGAIFFIGAGKLYYNGSYTSASASTTLSIKKVTSGSLGTTYQAGLAQPSAPVIFAVTPPAGYTGKNGGNVSVKIARVRSATGARSIASLTSNILSTTSPQSVAVTFPLPDANGQDYWEVDVTKNGEGGIGNHYFLQEIAESTIAETITANATTATAVTIGVPNGTLTSANIGWTYASSGDTDTYITAVGGNDSYAAGKQEITLAAASVLSTTQSATFTRAVNGVERTYVFEWVNADLSGADLAPYLDYPPPAGIFGGVINDVVFVDGAMGDSVNTTDNSANTTTTYRGNVIAVSEPAKPESFPPDGYLFCADSPTALIEGGEGLYWRFGANSLGIIRYVGGSPAINYEKFWGGVGVQNQNNVTLGAGGRLYAFTGQRGAVRLGANGMPDVEFALPVVDDMASWTAANTVLGFDANHGYVLFMNGTTILAYYEADGRWCAPCDISPTVGAKTIKSAVTVNGECYIAAGDNSEIKLYSFNSGTGSLGKAVTSWIPTAGEFDIVSRVRSAIRADNTSSATIKVYSNGSNTASSSQTVTVPATGFQQLTTVRPNVRGCRVSRAAVEFTSSGSDAGIEFIELLGDTSNITR